MRPGSRIPSIPGNSEPWVFIKGIDKILKRDLEKHKGLLERSKLEMDTYKQAVSQLVKRKKHYSGLIGKGEYSDEALKRGIDFMVVDLRSMTDKVRLSQEAIEHHKLIVDTLTSQLIKYHLNEVRFAEAKSNAPGN